ncbi:MAG TPA: hypothetical protein VNG69_11880 [Casimicrobiaceae bacterium]|nr:hypothetical protein [Casimicrobiaceae bacterium]
MLASTVPALAGEPLTTDDASILPRGICQIESWHRWSSGGGHEGWLLPACSVTDYLELSAGGARYRDADVGGHSLYQLQAKTVFASDPDGRWSAGAVFGAIRDGGHEERSRAFHLASALGLVSFAALDNALRVHANAGLAYSRREYRTSAWGTAVEFDFRENWTAMAEIFRDSPGRPSYQIGLRYLLVTDRVELFVSGGDRLGGESKNWFAKFGVRFQSWQLF